MKITFKSYHAHFGAQIHTHFWKLEAIGRALGPETLSEVAFFARFWFMSPQIPKGSNAHIGHTSFAPRKNLWTSKRMSRRKKQPRGTLGGLHPSTLVRVAKNGHGSGPQDMLDKVCRLPSSCVTYLAQKRGLKHSTIERCTNLTAC